MEIEGDMTSGGRKRGHFYSCDSIVFIVHKKIKSTSTRDRPPNS